MFGQSTYILVPIMDIMLSCVLDCFSCVSHKDKFSSLLFLLEEKKEMLKLLPYSLVSYKKTQQY